MSSSSSTFSDSETIDDTNSTISDAGEFAYCKICELNYVNTNKQVYGYSWKSGNTTNLINHLRDKHEITKDNYLEYLDESEEPCVELTNLNSSPYSPK
ncbi:hypothetical protein GLOIN_2v1788091 [Rhizophagus irregularis DAOM 181602=DAOM 197198]|nr:hypothetical protein GLOIN_2v1788091 [Rhizophagus irregularis DAOM 181602=DAOM 197198]